MKTSLLALFAVFSIFTLSGQGLQIRNNSRYYIDGVRISRQEALVLAAPYVDVTQYIKSGVAMKRTAIGLGIAGPLVGYVGMTGIIYSAFAHDRNSAIAFGIAAGLGGAMIWTALGLAIGSGGAQRKAMRLYNGYVDAGDYGSVPDREAACLSLSPTVGGLGLQLTF